MSDRARDFLSDWLCSHIEPLPPVKRVAASVRLAAQCRRDATANGIPLQEIRDAVGGDLIRTILQASDIAGDWHDQVRPFPETPALVKGSRP